MKEVNVVAAVIFRENKENKKEVFATQRGYGEFKDGWEFPGGKIELNETPQAALKREIKEELETDILVAEKLGTVEYDYPMFHLNMQCFVCKIISGNLKLLEHKKSSWLTKENLQSVNWLPADIKILDAVSKYL